LEFQEEFQSRTEKMHRRKIRVILAGMARIAKKFAVVLSLCVLMLGGAAFADSASGRMVLSANQNWKFFRADDPKSVAEGTLPDDANWEKVNLPHTVRLEPLNAAGGENFQGVCWYARHFTPDDAWKDRVVYLRFEGAMQVADVWLNGQKLTTHFGGYQPFTIDISKSLQFGKENVLMVRLDNSDNKEVPPGKPQNQLDFTYFGGLYRDIDLIVLDKLHITDEILANKVAGGGVFVSYPNVAADSATVQVQADVQNGFADAKKATVIEELDDTTGTVVASSSADMPLAPATDGVSTQQLKVKNPRLWHPNHPDLYTLVTTVKDGDRVADQIKTRIGLRKIEFTVDKGMLINGERFISIGANRHQDHPYVGYAIPASGQYRDAKLLREAGYTSFRSHYPQDRAFLDACDELGILVIESNPGWQIGGDELFTQRVNQDAREMIRRERNRPSVILWEAQLNETYSYDSKHFAELEKLVHEEYPFPGCYAAGDSVEKKAGGDDWDVVYNNAKGDKPHWQREYGDSVDNWSDQQSSSRVARGWGETPMLVQAWRHVALFNKILADDQSGATKPALCGVDIWAGVDAYRGYHHQPFYGGPYDLFRLPKFDAYFFQSQRPADLHIPGLNDGPMVFIANFATFQSPSTVTVFSNCEEVRLSQNGKEIATQKPVTHLTGLAHPPFTFKINQMSSEGDTMFMTGVAQPGTKVGELKAEGLIGGKVVATHTVHAPGVAKKLMLEADLKDRDLTADGSDWVRVYARVTDARGTVAPYADDLITFTTDGPGEIIADAHAANNPVRADAGIATALVRVSNAPGEITVKATAFGLSAGEVKIVSKPPARSFLP
jgi:beta-galactosidase